MSFSHIVIQYKFPDPQSAEYAREWGEYGVELILTELTGNELFYRGESLSFIRAVNRYADFRATAHSQHHEPHDALAIHPLIIFFHRHICLKSASDSHKLCGRAGVDSELVENSDFFRYHKSERYVFGGIIRICGVLASFF